MVSGALGRVSNALAQLRRHLGHVAVQRRQQLLATGVGVRVELGGVVAQLHQPLRHRALRHPLLAQDHVQLGGDLRHLLQPQPVHFRGGERGGGRRVQRRGVVAVALRQPPAARVVAGAGPRLARGGDLPVERGVNLAGDDGLGPGAVGVAVEARRLGPAAHALHQHHVVDGAVAQGGHLLQRRVQREVGRQHAAGLVGAEALHVLVHDHREGAQAVEVGVGVVGGADLVRAVQEVRHVLIGARQLADHVGGVAAAAGAEGEARPPVDGLPGRVLHHLVVDARGGREPRPIHRLQAPQPVPLLREAALLLGLRTGVQPVLQRRARPLVQPQGGGGLGAVVHLLLEEGVQQRAQPRVLRPADGRRGCGGRPVRRGLGRERTRGGEAGDGGRAGQEVATMQHGESFGDGGHAEPRRSATTRSSTASGMEPEVSTVSWKARRSGPRRRRHCSRRRSRSSLPSM